MKNTWKKFAALALALCLLISVLPPVAVAADASTTYTYDFMRKSTGAIANTVKLNTIKSYESSGNGLWMFAGEWSTNALVAVNDTATGGIIEAVRLNYGSKKASANYYAFYINVPEAGTYDLSITHTSGYYTTISNVYLVPSSVVGASGAFDATALKTELANLKTSEYYVGEIKDEVNTTKKAGNIAELGQKELAAGEYVLAFNIDADNSTNYYLYLRSFILEKQGSEEPDSGESTPTTESTPEGTTNPDKDAYLNFHLNGDSEFKYSENAIEFDGAGFDPRNTNTTTTGYAIYQYYKNGDLNWYARYSTANGAAFGADDTWDGLRAYTSTAGTTGFVAIVMRSPGEGEYKLTLNHGVLNKGGKGEVHIIPGTPATTAIAGMVNENTFAFGFDCKGENEAYGERGVATGNYTFGTSAEYTVVFKITEGGGTGMIYLSSMDVEAVPAVKPTFDFTEIEAANGKTLTGSNSCPDIKTAYTNGTINWQFWGAKDYSESVMGGAGNIWSGLKFGAAAGATTGYGFVAYYIKPAKTGIYTVTAHYQTHSDLNGEVNVYVIPGNTAWTNVGKVAKASEALGSYNCNSDRAEYVNAKTTLGNTVKLLGGTQYIAVFLINNATENAVTGTIKGLTMTRNNVLAVGENGYATLEEAAAAAAETQDKLVTLTDDAFVGDYALPAGVTLDLNGHKLESTGALVAVEGNVVDSSDGNNGRILRPSGSVTFGDTNEDLPVWDYVNKAYSFYDYKLESDTCEPDGDDVTRQKFWFKFHFYTNDDCTTLDQDAYDLVKQGYSGIEIRTKLTWADEDLKTVYFGDPDPDNNGENNTDLFARRWADEATENRWLYVVISGLDEDLVGTLTVQPEIEVSGVVISSKAMSYESGK